MKDKLDNHDGLVEPAVKVKRYFMRNMPEDLHRELKAQAALLGITLESLIVSVLRNYMERSKSAT